MSDKKTAKPAKKTAPKADAAAKKSQSKVKVEHASQVKADGNGKKKSSIHANYREISVVMTDGKTFKTRSTYSQDTLKLDIDVNTHPAWTNESNFVNLKADKVSALLKKYDGLSFLKKQ